MTSLALVAVAAAQSSSPYDILAYRLAVTIDFAESPGPESPYRPYFSALNKLEAEATIRLTNVSDEPQEEISLILHRLMTASAVEAGGQSLTFEQHLRGLENWENFHINHLEVRWGEPLAPGAEASLTVRYAGQLIGYPEVGMLYVRETLDPDFTILRYETFCYPQVSRPERDAVSAARQFDPFDQEVEITVPEGHVVVTGGQPLGLETNDGKTTYSLASYEPDGIMMIPIAPYQVATNGPHRIFHFADSAEGAHILMGSLERVMALFTTWFGPPQLERGLTIAEIPSFFGSQAGPLILQTTAAFTDPARHQEFYHELSHLWNPPDTDPKPARWNEGLATFLQGLVEDRIARPGFLDEHLTGIFLRVRTNLETNEKARTVAPIDYGQEDMTGYSYSVGALFFALLHHQVGEERFLAFLHDYFQQHRTSGSGDRDFAAAIVSTLPETRDLVDDWFLTPAFAEAIRDAGGWEELQRSYE